MNCLDLNEKYKFLLHKSKYYGYDEDDVNFFANQQICRHQGTVKKLDQNKMKTLHNLMIRCTQFLTKHNVVHWLDGGSLLGAVRDGKIISHDDDGDFAIPYDHYKKIAKKILALPKEGKYHYDKEFDLNLIVYLQFNKLKIFRTQDYLIRAFDGDIYVDMIAYFPYQNNYIANSIYWYKTFQYASEDIFPIQKIKLSNYSFPSIKNPYPFLNRGYKFWKHLAVAKKDKYEGLFRDREYLWIIDNNEPFDKYKSIKNNDKKSNNIILLMSIIIFFLLVRY
jgi:lipopolysaccharide cholinephosphotransferase